MTEPARQSVAFLGLGVMGRPMAGHLADAGHDVSVFNRTAARATDWARRFPGRVATTPADAATGAEAVFMCLGDDASVRDVVLGDSGVLPAMAPGSVLVDHTTASAALAVELHALASRREVGFVDAPVSGGEAGAVNGSLTIMAGGEQADVAAAMALWSSYAGNAQHIGGPGTGALAKMVNQICIAGLVQGLSEGLRFLEACDLDSERVMAAIGKGAAQSWQMDNRQRTMLRREFDFGFAVDWMRKDLGMALAEAQRRGVQLPVAERVDGFYARIQKAGGGRWDTSSLITLLDDARADGEPPSR